MRRRRLAALAGALLASGGCLQPPQTPCPPDRLPPREWVRSPETVFDFFRECLRCGEYRLAYQVLSGGTRREIGEDEFVALFRNSIDLYRTVAFSRKERIEEGAGAGEKILVLRHDLSGVRHRILLREEGGIWTLAEGEEQFRAFMREVSRGERDRAHQYR